ncbi:MAG: TatD family hydrolase [Mucinivorans sp.]
MQRYDFFNIHSHRNTLSDNYLTINSIILKGEPISIQGYVSAGVHPWSVIQAQDNWLDIPWRDTMAVGEIGLDCALAQNSLKKQREWFERQIDIANEFQKPLIIHCVRAFPEVLKAIENKATTPFIFHGFNSSTKWLTKITETDGYISFGEELFRWNSAKTALKTTPLDKILLETDESELSIEEIYKIAAQTLAIDIKELQCIIRANFMQIWQQNNGQTGQNYL